MATDAQIIHFIRSKSPRGATSAEVADYVNMDRDDDEWQILSNRLSRHQNVIKLLGEWPDGQVGVLFIYDEV